MKVAGGCHCGAVRFSIDIDPHPRLLDCNCSICSKTGYLHLIVPEAEFSLQSGAEHLESYRFGTGAAEHLFCRTCGIKSFYRPRSHPEAWSVNFRCLDAGHRVDPQIEPFDGRDWENAERLLKG